MNSCSSKFIYTGLPFSRGEGYAIPAGRAGGMPNDDGVIFNGATFYLDEGNGYYTDGYVEFDGENVVGTMDSLQYGIAYEKTTWKRIE